MFKSLTAGLLFVSLLGGSRITYAITCQDAFAGIGAHVGSNQVKPISDFIIDALKLSEQRRLTSQRLDLAVVNGNHKVALSGKVRIYEGRAYAFGESELSMTSFETGKIQPLQVPNGISEIIDVAPMGNDKIAIASSEGISVLNLKNSQVESVFQLGTKFKPTRLKFVQGQLMVVNNHSELIEINSSGNTKVRIGSSLKVKIIDFDVEGDRTFLLTSTTMKIRGQEIEETELYAIDPENGEAAHDFVLGALPLFNSPRSVQYADGILYVAGVTGINAYFTRAPQRDPVVLWDGKSEFLSATTNGYEIFVYAQNKQRGAKPGQQRLVTFRISDSLAPSAPP